MPESIPPQKHIHFIGMGGIGMSALALILAERGHSVSGSDRKLTPAMQALESKALALFGSQVSNNFAHLDASGIKSPLVVVSTASSGWATGRTGCA